MIKSYFLITLRSMMKNKLFVMINIIGLGLSIGVCITAFPNWKFNDQWDSQQRQAAGIYRIQSWHEVNGKSDRFGSVPVPLAENIRPVLNDDEEASASAVAARLAVYF